LQTTSFLKDSDYKSERRNLEYSSARDKLLKYLLASTEDQDISPKTLFQYHPFLPYPKKNSLTIIPDQYLQISGQTLVNELFGPGSTERLLNVLTNSKYLIFATTLLFVFNSLYWLGMLFIINVNWTFLAVFFPILFVFLPAFFSYRS